MAEPDFIDLFLTYTEGIASPERFRLWTAITCIAGALERRVFTITTGKPAFPNLITMLVGPPGTGKNESINVAEDLWHESSEFCVAPNNVTKAALIDALVESERNIIVDNTTLIGFHSLLVAAPEFGVLVPAHDLEFLSVINYIWDNPRSYKEKRRGLRCPENPRGELIVNKPNMTILAGTQPGYLSSLLPEEAWTMGTTSRMILVYSTEAPDVPLFNTKMRPQLVFDHLLREVKRIAAMIGPMQWEMDAMLAAEKWRAQQCNPAPTHSKLLHWLPRRMFTVIKLAIISSAARGGDMLITLFDFERGRRWLLEVEAVMPDVFRDMTNRSDKAVIDELYNYAWGAYVRDKGPVHKSSLARFLSTRLPEPRIEGMIKLLVQMNILSDKGEGFYQPQPQHVHGVE